MIHSILENKVLARDAELWGRTQEILELTSQRDLAVEAITRAIDMAGHPDNINH